MEAPDFFPIISQLFRVWLSNSDNEGFLAVISILTTLTEAFYFGEINWTLVTLSLVLGLGPCFKGLTEIASNDIRLKLDL